MSRTIIKLSLFIVILTILGFFYLKTDRTIFGICPKGYVMMGKVSKACLKVPEGAEDEVRQMYNIVEMKSVQTTEQYIAIVFDKPTQVEQVIQLLGSLHFKCRLVYFYDFKSEMYSSRETSEDCKYLSSTVEKFSSGNTSTTTPRPSVVLSVTGMGVPAEMLDFWRNNTEQVRAVSISLFSNALPPQFKPYPEVTE